MPLDDEASARKLVEIIERKIAGGFRSAVAWLQSRVSLDSLVAAIEQGRLADLVSDRDITRAAARIAAGTSDAYVTAGQAVAKRLAELLEHPVSFDGTAPRAVRAIREASLEAIREITQETRAVVRQAIADGLQAGTNPRANARMIRSSLGLTEHQRQIVSNFRAKLVNGDRGALDYKLRDKRFDAAIRGAARAGGKPLTEAQISTMTDAYARKFVAFRAESVARTEALRAAHAGADEAWQQALESGDVDGDALVDEWRHGRRKATSRDGHVAMHGQRRAVGVRFRNPLTGNLLRYPCDLDAPASETIRCACVRVRRFRKPGDPAPQVTP